MALVLSPLINVQRTGFLDILIDFWGLFSGRVWVVRVSWFLIEGGQGSLRIFGGYFKEKA